MDRRDFLRMLGLGAAAVATAPYVPKRTYSFLGGILRPRQEIIKPVVRLEASNDMVNWVGITGIDFMDVMPVSEVSGGVDALMILDQHNIMDFRTAHLRYVRVTADSPAAYLSPAKPSFLLAT